MTLTVEQIESLRRGEPVRLSPPELGESVVVIRETEFRGLQELLEDEKEKAGWAQLARKARDSWAEENAY
jgi:hypothetical protein